MRQEVLMQELGVDEVHIDRFLSGKNTDRPGCGGKTLACGYHQRSGSHASSGFSGFSRVSRFAKK